MINNSLKSVKHEIECCIVINYICSAEAPKPEILCVGRTHCQKERMTNCCGKAENYLNLSKCHDQITV